MANQILFTNGLDFHLSGITIDYTTVYPDENDPNYGEIEDAHVTEVDIDLIVRRVVGTKSLTIDSYAIDRILRLNKTYVYDSWDIRVGMGYYGQEIEGVFLREHLASAVDSQIAGVIYLQNDDFKVEEILRLEYGNLLPELEGRSWTVEKVKRDQIKHGNHAYQKRLDDASVSMYADYKGVRGVVIPKGDGYRLIDGYHRCRDAVGTIRVLVGRLPNEQASQ
jgi:hypothetical protein